MVSAVEKGDELEDKFHRFLLDQQSQGNLVYGAYPSNLCKIYKKKKYYCSERENDVTFDVVIEVFREGGSSPHLHVIFECKNHEDAVAESKITDFSDKLGRIFKHGAKGIVVVTSRLQSGAEKIARKRKIGIAKYDHHGLEITADRKGRAFAESKFVASQIFQNVRPVKSLKFSAYDNGNFFGSIGQLLRSYDADQTGGDELAGDSDGVSVPYISDHIIRDSAQKLLDQIGCRQLAVDLDAICSALSIDLKTTDKEVQDEEGNPILGSVNFDRKTIRIHAHQNENQRRFTIGHEIGHFYLKHDEYLRSEYIVEKDLVRGKLERR